MEYEYCLTYTMVLLEPSEPEIPEGKGWEMCAMTFADNKLCWAWRREIKEP